MTVPAYLMPNTHPTYLSNTHPTPIKESTLSSLIAACLKSLGTENAGVRADRSLDSVVIDADAESWSVGAGPVIGSVGGVPVMVLNNDVR